MTQMSLSSCGKGWAGRLENVARHLWCWVRVWLLAVFMCVVRSKPCTGIAFPAAVPTEARENQWLSSEVRPAFSGARCTTQQVWRKKNTPLRYEPASCWTFEVPHQPGFPLDLNLKASSCPLSATFPSLEDCFHSVNIEVTHRAYNTTFVPIFKCLLNYFQDSNYF